MVIVDYSQTAISTLMAELKGRTDAEISTPLIRHMIINALRSYKVKYGKEYGNLVIACDNKKYWRKSIFPNYKANRKKARDDSGFDWHAIFEALNQVKVELDEHFPYALIDVDGAEADDVIASLVFWSQENNLQQNGLFEEPEPILIISGDHDFVQLQRYNNVKQYSPIQRNWVKAEDSADFVLMEHILSGDKGDGVPNFLSPDDTFVAGKRQKPIRKKDLEVWRKQSIVEWAGTPNEQNVKRNAELIDLRNIPNDIQNAIINNYTVQLPSRNKSQLLNYFIANKMKNMIEHLGEF